LNASIAVALIPVDVLTFIQMKGFSAEWDALGLSDEDLRAMELGIMAQPRRAPVMRGTGGLRKYRFSPRGWPRGKSGSLRICFVYFQEFAMVLLVVAYRKGEMDNLSAQGRKAIKTLIEKQRKEISTRPLR
jgi:hypothetical protein